MKRLSLRGRLTLVYGGLFLLAGIVLLGVTYVLVDQRTPQPFRTEFLDRGTLPTRTYPSEQDFERFRALIQDVQSEAKRDALESLLTQGGIALVVVSAAAVAIGWLIAGRALQPLHQITGTARRIASADSAGRGLHERIALTGPRDEVRELADTFDQMLERLDRSFDGQRRFVANASHELRTPLTINRALVELAVSRPDAPAELRRLGEALLSVNERHERLIDGLLTLADSENELTERAEVDLAEIAAYVIDQAGAASPGIAVRRSLDPAPTQGDPVLLERLTFNLVENALRHNVPADGWVEVRTAMAAGRPTLVVVNTGPVVPGYDIETMFQPFRRLSRERLAGARGFGLGLSIVRAVARAHGGTAEAAPRPGGGLTVTVTLPPA
ncbi:sensor histidine kinase [Micromonospora endophytica]|uniref:histidine kinase n=1 Tax=Micromonospora endophytica TaxID=515350 RepID=A0A2W2DA67_9ACTN|nr:HAMP domain-containing sensor histidine kinase [Micromonospora endophytica]PZG00809.1 two-component sensor histidine kinase [Micromonospora endophytica]RIW42067.1 sensor histidine kinase [Micromonospora endophytica]BCJ59669.1 sensor protein CutS [Micromonospora endophytica]